MLVGELLVRRLWLVLRGLLDWGSRWRVGVCLLGLVFGGLLGRCLRLRLLVCLRVQRALEYPELLDRCLRRRLWVYWQALGCSKLLGRCLRRQRLAKACLLGLHLELQPRHLR